MAILDRVLPSDTALPSSGPLYVAGGRQRALRPLTASDSDWYEYEAGVILEVDPATSRAASVLEHVTAPEACPPEDPAILFKSGTLVGDRLYACTQTEVLVYQVPSFERVTYLSLPQFNDVHHVRPTPAGGLLIANTGLDQVIETDAAGRIVSEWNLTDEPTWSRFSRDVDYRRVKTTKPHRAHPNHVFHLGDEPWATRFEQRDAVSLRDPGRRIDIGLERVHDGVVHGDRIYFTTVDGRVAIADAVSLRVVEVIDLAALQPPGTRLGWCRGILPDGDRAWVGFSRIRPTRFRENIGWVVHGFKRDVGTHVGHYDLARRHVLDEIPLEEAGLSAVFGIFPVPGPGTAIERGLSPGEGT